MIIYSDDSKQILRDIRIKGEFPLFKKNIINSLNIMSGDSVDNDILELQIDNIKKYLIREGFLNSQIQLEKNYNEEKDFLDILFRITKSKRIKIDDIKFRGNESFSDFKLAFRYNIWDYFIFPTRIGRGYNESDLNNNLRDLIKFYRNSGFPECQIDQEIVIDTLNQKTIINVNIAEGAKYKWKLSDIGPFRKDEIRKTFDFSKRGNFKDVALKRGVNSIKQKLSDWGYDDYSVIINDTLINKKNAIVRFLTPQITVKKRVLVSALTINGNNSFALPEIEKKIWLSDKGEKRRGKGVYTELILNDDLAAIESFYRSEGFYKVSTDAKVRMLNDSQNCEIEINITEGQATLIKDINVIGVDKKDLNGDPNGKIKTNSRFREKDIANLIKRYTTAVSENGYPDVNVVYAINFNDDSSMVSIDINIGKGHAKNIGEIQFSGNFRTHSGYLLKQSGLESGDPFVASKISKAMSSIRNTSLFERVYYKVIVDENNPGLNNIKIFLSEKEALKLNGSIGYETENGAYVKFAASNKNIFGFNKSLILSGELSPEERFLGLRYVEPDFFIKRSSLWINLYFKTEELMNRTVISKKFGNSYGVVIKLLKQSEASLGLSYELRNTARHVITLTPKITFDARDSFIRPHKGAYSLVEANLSNGLRSSNSDDYFNLVVDLRSYLPVFKKAVIALRAKGEGITPYGLSDSIAVDQLLTLGGNSSVRGYKKDMLFRMTKSEPRKGFIALNTNAEIRVELTPFLESMIFLDAGTIASQTDFDALQKPKFSVGPGLSLLTPIGPIGLAYGFKLKKESGEKAGALHFSIGYIF